MTFSVFSYNLIWRWYYLQLMTFIRSVKYIYPYAYITKYTPITLSFSCRTIKCYMVVYTYSFVIIQNVVIKSNNLWKVPNLLNKLLYNIMITLTSQILGKLSSKLFSIIAWHWDDVCGSNRSSWKQGNDSSTFMKGVNLLFTRELLCL